MKKDIFLHVCCAPCLIYLCGYFKEKNISWKGYFFNPNIHPGQEYEKRAECLGNFVSKNNYSVDFAGGTRAGDYSFEKEFIGKTGVDREHWKINRNSRCNICYKWRLFETAGKAKKEGYRYFSTTLLISPYQDHEKIRALGNEAAEKFGLEFFYKDFRPFFREGRKMAKENNFYLQKYCGCLYSRGEALPRHAPERYMASPKIKQE